LRSSLGLLKCTLTSGVGEIGEGPRIVKRTFFEKFRFSKSAAICVVLRVITGLKAPLHFAIILLKSAKTTALYRLPQGTKKFQSGGPPFWVRPCFRGKVRRSRLALSLIDVGHRALQKVGWGGHCGMHRLGATCDFMKSN
jgi:hypothetical protein